MHLLLDTHMWLWMVNSPEKFSPTARRHILKEENELVLSAVSTWEIAIKYSLKKLPLPEHPDEFVPRLLATTRVSPMAIQVRHTLRVAELPRHHSDPFDRLLIAQAQLESLSILTVDKQFRQYDVNIVWAH